MRDSIRKRLNERREVLSRQPPDTPVLFCYGCPICESKFRTKGALSIHLKVTHGIGPRDPRIKDLDLA